MAGCGKTILRYTTLCVAVYVCGFFFNTRHSYSIIDYLGRSCRPTREQYFTGYFYFNFSDPTKRDVSNLLRVLIS